MVLVLYTVDHTVIPCTYRARSANIPPSSVAMQGGGGGGGGGGGDGGSGKQVVGEGGETCINTIRHNNL